MSRALPFTEASLARRIKGVQRAGLYVVGVRPDSTLIVSDKPIDATSPVREIAQPSPPAPKRLEDYFDGGQGEA